MTHITLTSDQAATIRDAVTPVLIHDPQGLVVGVLDRSNDSVASVIGFSLEEITAAEKAAEQSPTWHTLSEIWDRLRLEHPEKFK